MACEQHSFQKLLFYLRCNIQQVNLFCSNGPFQDYLLQFFLLIILYHFCMNIYIGNLNYRVRESDLQQVLEEYGVVESVKLIIDRDTNRSKGFAFAEFTNESEARNAINELNGAEYEGRQMVVKEATPRR